MKKYFSDHKQNFLLITCFIVIYLFGLTTIGPEYDEVLVANAALNCPSNTFIDFTFWIGDTCYPLMLSSYIGGIMALPYRIAFLITGGNVLSFRLIGVSIFALSLSLIYLSLKKLFNKKIALIVASLLITDFQLWFNVRFERTTVVPLLLKSIWLFLFVKLVGKKRVAYYFLFGIFTGLMIWAKLDAVFFFIAIAGGLFFTNTLKATNLFKIVRNELRLILVFLAGLAIGLFPLFVYFSYSWQHFIFIGRNVAKVDLANDIISKISLIFWQFSNFDGIWYVFKVRPDLNLILVISTVILWFFLLKFTFQRKNKIEKFLLTAVVLFWLVFLLFGGLRFSHHRYLIYPLPQLLLAMFLTKLSKKLQTLFCLAWFFIFIFSYTATLKLSTNGGVGAFSSNIYHLSNELQLRIVSDERILVGDWGITNQLILINSGDFKIDEIAFLANFDKGEIMSELLKNKLNDCDYLILRDKSRAIFTNADYNLRSIFSGNMVYTDQEFELFECNNAIKHN